MCPNWEARRLRLMTHRQRRVASGINDKYVHTYQIRGLVQHRATRACEVNSKSGFAGFATKERNGLCCADLDAAPHFPGPTLQSPTESGPRPGSDPGLPAETRSDGDYWCEPWHLYISLTSVFFRQYVTLLPDLEGDPGWDGIRASPVDLLSASVFPTPHLHQSRSRSASLTSPCCSISRHDCEQFPRNPGRRRPVFDIDWRSGRIQIREGDREQ